MASFTDIREALAANLASVTGLQENAYVLSQPTPPAAEVMPAPIEYDRAFGRGLDRLNFIVRVFVGFTQDIGAQKRLDSMLASTGAASIKTALESDKTLGGLVDDLHVTGTSGYQLFSRAGSAPVLGAEWQVTILSSP